MTVTQGVKLDPETRDRLKALGELRRRSPHWLMRAAIEDFLHREEAVEREKRQDIERWQACELTGHTIGHETASAWLEDLAAGKISQRPK
jgi:predicted transcriptional regulator